MSILGNEQDPHEYDGIKELDNPPPTLFTMLFYGCILFAWAYAGYYLAGDGAPQAAEYAKKYATLDALKRAHANEERARPLTEADLLGASQDPAQTLKGRSVYQSKCASCHGDQGQGGIGPNLCDRFWIHGGKGVEIEKTVSEGVAEKGMPPWGGILTRDERREIVGFLISLRDTQPGGAKAAQGVRVEKYE